MSSEGCFRQRLSTIAASWRVLALRGLSALIFGLVILFWPGLILAVLPLSPFQRLCHGGRDNRSRARAQDLRSRRAKVASTGRRNGGCRRRSGGSSLACDDTTRAALRHRGVGSCDRHTQDNQLNRTTWRGGERVAACRQRRAVGALGRDPCGPSGLRRSAGHGAAHRDFRHSGGRGADRLRFPDAGPTTAWAGLSLRNPELLAPTVIRRALMDSGSDSVVRHSHCPVLVVRE
jgi:hypothetical protein